MYIIIGASSFIGVYTATYFAEQGEDVIVTGRNGKFREYYEKLGVKYVNLDLKNEADFEKLPKEGVDGVILISGALPASEDADLKDHENAAEYIEVNTIGTIRALEYCRRNGIRRLINTISFADVANALRLDPPIDETEPRDFSYEGDHSVYVKDVAQAYYKVAKSEDASGLYNITSGHATTLLEQAEVCRDIFAVNGKRSEVIYNDIENKGKSYLFSIEKAKRDFGYAPKYAGFKEMMRDYAYELERGVYSDLFSTREV